MDVDLSDKAYALAHKSHLGDHVPKMLPYLAQLHWLPRKYSRKSTKRQISTM